MFEKVGKELGEKIVKSSENIKSGAEEIKNGLKTTEVTSEKIKESADKIREASKEISNGLEKVNQAADKIQSGLIKFAYILGGALVISALINNNHHKP